MKNEILAKLITEAKEIIQKENAKSYCISTIIPLDWMIEEEKEFDKKLDFECIKNRINRAIPKELGGNYEREGEIRLIFDFKKKTVGFERMPIFIFGRYMKHKKGLSQSRWVDSDGTALYISVEEKIGDPIKKIFQADDYVLHASGREDVDATNSAGRAFVLELINPKFRDVKTPDIINSVFGDVTIKDVKIVERRFLEFVTESHFDKTYRALVEFKREITVDDVEKIQTIEGSSLMQKTPTRVMHRRANLTRPRKVKLLKVETFSGNKAIIIVKAEPGTYIKEMISGDNGRTSPSIAEILDVEAKCIELEVIEIDDGFMDFILQTS